MGEVTGRRTVVRRFGLVGLAVIVLVGCHHAGPADGGKPQGVRGEAIETVCFTGGFSGFYEISDRSLVLRRSPSESVLVETGYCPNLNALEGLKIDGAGNCLSRGDRLQVFDTQFPEAGSPSDRPDRCLVHAIHEWVPSEPSDP